MPGSSWKIELASFIEELGRVPWFQSVGRPLSKAGDVERHADRSAWPGPEAENVEALHDDLKTWDARIGSPSDDRERPGLLDWITSPGHSARARTGGIVFDRIQAAVLTAAGDALPGYEPDRDPWHPQTAPVRSAAYVAALRGCYRALAVTPPKKLAECWNWSARGHWPCGYARTPRPSKTGRLLVY